MNKNPEISQSEQDMINHFNSLRHREVTPDGYAHFTTRGEFADMSIERQAEILAGSPMTPEEKAKFDQSVAAAEKERQTHPESNSALNRSNQSDS